MHEINFLISSISQRKVFCLEDVLLAEIYKMQRVSVSLFSGESGAQCKFKLNFLVFASFRLFPPASQSGPQKTTKNYVFICWDWIERAPENGEEKLFNYCLELCLDIKFIYNLVENIHFHFNSFSACLSSESKISKMCFGCSPDLKMELNV